MNPAERALAAAVRADNALIHRFGASEPNPRPLGGLDWHRALAGRTPEIRAEWLAFRDAGGRLPRIEDLLGEHQGNTEVWAAGLLWSRGRPAGPLPARFPATVSALGVVPGLRSALWSVLHPGSEIPAHRGPNAGVLRYHLGVVCPPGAVLRVNGTDVPYVEGEGILFDDTVEHSARNPATTERVTLFCEVERPLRPPWGPVNRTVQRLMGLDPRYRGAVDRAVAWDRALNPGPC